MQRLVLAGRKAWLVDEPDPQPEGDWVVVKIHVSPICGSDKGAFLGEQPNRRAGHEGAGEVVAVDRPAHLKAGDRVVLMPAAACGVCERCRRGDQIFCPNAPSWDGHFAQYVKKQEQLCMPLPADISYEIGSLAGCGLGPAFDALTRMAIAPMDTLLITGLGPVGLGALTIAKLHGARVIAVEGEPWRRSRALDMGADEVLDASAEDLLARIRDLTGGRGVDKAIDCSGSAAAERLCIDAATVRGWVAFVGENPNEIPLGPSRDLIRRGLTLIGSWHYNLTQFPHILEVLRRSPATPRLVSHRFPMSQAQEAFETFLSGKAAKVLLLPWA